MLFNEQCIGYFTYLVTHFMAYHYFNYKSLNQSASAASFNERSSMWKEPWQNKRYRTMQNWKVQFFPPFRWQWCLGPLMELIIFDRMGLERTHKSISLTEQNLFSRERHFLFKHLWCSSRGTNKTKLIKMVLRNKLR